MMITNVAVTPFGTFTTRSRKPKTFCVVWRVLGGVTPGGIIVPSFTATKKPPRAKSEGAYILLGIFPSTPEQP